MNVGQWRCFHTFCPFTIVLSFILYRFALGRFCAAEGIDGVKTLSAFRSSFGDDYGLTMATGGLATLLSRSIVVIDSEGHVAYTQQVPEIGQEPDYEAALSALAEAV